MAGAVSAAFPEKIVLNGQQRLTTMFCSRSSRFSLSFAAIRALVKDDFPVAADFLPDRTAV